MSTTSRQPRLDFRASPAVVIVYDTVLDLPVHRVLVTEEQDTSGAVALALNWIATQESRSCQR